MFYLKCAFCVSIKLSLQMPGSSNGHSVRPGSGPPGRSVLCWIDGRGLFWDTGTPLPPSATDYTASARSLGGRFGVLRWTAMFCSQMKELITGPQIVFTSQRELSHQYSMLVSVTILVSPTVLSVEPLNTGPSQGPSHGDSVQSGDRSAWVRGSIHPSHDLFGFSFNIATWW